MFLFIKPTRRPVSLSLALFFLTFGETPGRIYTQNQVLYAIIAGRGSRFSSNYRDIAVHLYEEKGRIAIRNKEEEEEEEKGNRRELR